MELVVQNREESGYPLSFTRVDAQEGTIPLIWTPLMNQEDGFRSYPGDYGKQRRPSLVIPVKNGNYHVKVALGDKEREGRTSIKAGAGSIMLQQIRTKAGEITEREFIVRVEQQELRLAFLGDVPQVQSLQIKPIHCPTIFLAGDSTVCDQCSGHYPYTGWGQALPLFLTAGAVSNHAKSGRSSKSFIQEGRLERLESLLGKGDLLLIQFGHNDQKNDERGTAPFADYLTYLAEYVATANNKGATPVLMTPVHRRAFTESRWLEDTHGDYVRAVVGLSQMLGVACIDLAEKSKQLFEALGPEGTKPLFMWTDPNEYPQYPEGTEDNTHFHVKGAIEIARLVYEGITEQEGLRQTFGQANKTLKEEQR
ncbi:rhamnogalacturonan acetylesterase [Halalkalibacterium halodurans]|jgi:fibronectin type 3 domain-containing protein|uniref:rhamnogalacturonan acetylesterase n=1 Tax=Halalkalibacterium halodurans TaxID=86665 RepID=UPI0006A94D61|nr:GDSL-type esterase/lipase family protein [Halalkalibacterium halodurans]